MKKIFSKLILSGKNPFTDWKRANPDEPESFAEGGYGDISQIMIDFFTKGIKPDMRAGSKKQILTPTTFDELEAKEGKSKIKFKLGSKTYMFWFDPEDDKETIYKFFQGYSGADDDLSNNLENDLIKIYGEDAVSSNKIVDWAGGGGQLGKPYWSEAFISRDNYEKYIKPIAKQVSIVE